MSSLRIKFFIVILVICSFLTAGLYFFIKYSFQKDFWRYVEKKETRFAQPLINDLINNYREHKNWEWIENWEAYVIAQAEIEKKIISVKKEPNKTPTEDAPKNNNKNPPQTAEVTELREWRQFKYTPPNSALKSVFLLDVDKTLVAGKGYHIDDAFLLPIKEQNTIIGYLGVPFNPGIRDLQDADFAELQEEKLAFVIGIALIIAVFASFPLAHVLAQRISHLVEQVSLFSQGNYRGKIALKGKDELSILADHLNNLGEILAQSEQTRRQWVADISHELRTPIAVLQAELEAMEDGVRILNKESIQRLIKHNQRLKHLVNDLYELSLTDLGGMTYSKHNLDIAHLLKDTTLSLQPQFTYNNLQLAVEGAEQSIYVLGDNNRLQQLFLNLLKNSLQYTNAPGQTRVSIHTEDAQAVIVIEDSAPGVQEEHQAKLFDRLYRADSSRNRSTGGAGLGLSICKNIIAAHDGNISTSHSSLGGLRVTLRLPLTQESA